MKKNLLSYLYPVFNAFRAVFAVLEQSDTVYYGSTGKIVGAHVTYDDDNQPTHPTAATQF
jgi:hypothetical protein